jgi:hypothetical protein
MTHEFEIDPDRSLIIRRWTGEVTVDALVQGLAELEQHSDFDPRFDVIEDYSNARLVVSRSDLRAFRQEWRSRGFTKVGRWASVMPGNLEFGIGRQAEAIWKLDNARVCRTEEEALAWLGRLGEEAQQ